MARATPSVMLAAGGTGGHLFPAFALAQELGRRDIAVDLVTDMRGDRYGANFPARAVYRVPSATLAGQSIADRGWPHGLDAGARHCGVVSAARQREARRRGRLRRLSGLSADRGGTLRGIPTALHEQNAVLGRANRLLSGRVTAIATSFENTKYLSGGALQARASDRQPRARPGGRLGHAELSHPGSERSLLAAGVWRQPGRALLRRCAAPRPDAAARAIRASLFVVQQCREEDLARVEQAYQAAGVRAHLATFFANLPEEMAKAHLVIGRAGASTVAELTVMGRPGDAGAAAARG